MIIVDYLLVVLIIILSIQEATLIIVTLIPTIPPPIGIELIVIVMVYDLQDPQGHPAIHAIHQL